MRQVLETAEDAGSDGAESSLCSELQPTQAGDVLVHLSFAQVLLTRKVSVSLT